MSTAQATTNKATYSRYLDAVNSGDPEVIANTLDEVVDPNLRMHVAVPTGATGAQALKQVLAMLRRTYPDFHVTAEDMIAEGDKLVARNTVTGTHQGEFMGRPPTGKSVTYDEIFIYRFADGRIAEMWGVADALSAMRQLGVIAV
jgi:steroid delta-isomerase-like uncharacterized protein